MYSYDDKAVIHLHRGFLRLALSQQFLHGNDQAEKQSYKSIGDIARPTSAVFQERYLPACKPLSSTSSHLYHGDF